MIAQVRSLLAVVLLCLSSTLVSAQEIPSDAKRPKLGLVLEGGGALGLAHIGVLQWLEEHRIPVNVVAGTSMGGLVGGVYATGRNATEVRDLVKQIDWDLVLSGQPRFEYLSFRRKQDAHDYPSTLEFGLRHGLQFPSGFNSGALVALILDEISLPYGRIDNFDELPIPFACVATDLTTHSEHVFRSGSLGLALRSTMSLPGIFSPVRSGDHIYVDGGLLNNLPVDAAKEMGAEVTVAVNLETAPLNPDTDLSSFAVLNESISTVVIANERRSMEAADIVVSVPLQKFTGTDYNRGDAIVSAGYAAAEANSAKLLSLSVDEVTWQQYLAARDARRQRVATPQFVTVEGVPPKIAAPMADEMSSFAGKPVEIARLNDRILKMLGMGSLATLDYSMIEQDGKQGLEIQAAAKSYSPPIVRPLIVIDGSDYNDVFFSAGARITFLDFGGYRRELRNDVIVGSQFGLNSEYYRPLGPRSSWFVAPRAGVSSAQYPVYNDNTLVALYRNRMAVGGLDFGYGFGRSGELRLGYEGGYQSLSPQIGPQLLSTFSGATGNVRLQYIFNTLDDQTVPRNGEHITFDFKFFNANPGAPEAFPATELQIQNFFRIGDPSTVFFNAYGGTSFGYNAGVPLFPLGGVTRFAAYGTNSLLTDQYFLGQLGYIRQLKTLPPLLGSTIDLLGMVEVGKTYQLPFGPPPPRLPGDVVGAIIVNTLIGPVQVGGAVGNYGHAKAFFQVGRIF